MFAVNYSVGQVKEKNALGMYGTKQKENLIQYSIIFFWEVPYVISY